MSEKATWDKIRPTLKRFDAMRVENPCLPGTPDVNLCLGEGREVWIELKQQDKWPVKPETPVRLDHDMTQQQRIWHERRIEHGGRAYVFLQVARDYIMLDGKVAADIIGEATQAEIRAAAIFCVTSKDLPQALLALLR